MTAAMHTRLLQDTQGIRMNKVRAGTHIFARKCSPDYCAMTLHFIARLRQDTTNSTTIHEVGRAAAPPHLRQSCNCASTSGDSPAGECKTIMRASNSCLTLSENPHEVVNFVCDLLHSLTPAENRMVKRSYN